MVVEINLIRTHQQFKTASITEVYAKKTCDTSNRSIDIFDMAWHQSELKQDVSNVITPHLNLHRFINARIKPKMSLTSQ